MTLSVLTIVKNRAGHLAQLIEGLRRSDVHPDELVVVDMASETPVETGETPFPAIVMRLGTEGLPLAEARNAAASAATADLLLFLDVDCIPMRGLVGEMCECLERHDALICAEILYLGESDARNATWCEAELKMRALPHSARSFPQSGLREEVNAGLFWSLAFGIRHTRYFDLGGFDERFRGYGAEDTDFGFRARRTGVPLLFKGGAGAMHQHHDTFDPPLQHLEDIVRNANLFHETWNEWPMQGWIEAFESAGLVAMSGGALQVRRLPTAEAIKAARVM